MLVKFSFKNYGPFREEAEFDMRAVMAYKEHPYNLIEVDDRTKLLKTAAVYGANAGGKSSFILAYHNFSDFVQTSFNNMDQNGETEIQKHFNPYLFRKDRKDGTEYDAIFIHNGVEYHYGYIHNSTEILYEWLYRRNMKNGRKTVILEREGLKISLGASVKKSCEKYAEQIEKDVLALSFFNRLRLKTDVFKQTYDCVTLNLILYGVVAQFSQSLLDDYFSKRFNAKEKELLLEFLSAADVGIRDIRAEAQGDDIEVYTCHQDENGERYEVPIGIESDGTKKMIVLFHLVRICIAAKRILFVDELNLQLHPLMVKYIIDLFYEEGAEGQLIYTTHDTALLDRRYFRRDQVWFIEKDKYGASSLYSLAEFKVRGDASFEKEYLGGAYGAIPVLRNMEAQE